jgi:hypothetical protein
MGPPFQIPQDPVPEDQPLEQPEGAFHPSIANGHF